VRRRVPASSGPLALQAAAVITRLRTLDLAKPPGISEAIDWVSALAVLGVPRIDPGITEQTWGSIVKNRDDLELVGSRGAAWLLEGNDG
jgi:hypothetical protein